MALVGPKLVVGNSCIAHPQLVEGDLIGAARKGPRSALAGQGSNQLAKFLALIFGHGNYPIVVIARLFQVLIDEEKWLGELRESVDELGFFLPILVELLDNGIESEVLQNRSDAILNKNDCGSVVA